MWFIWYEDQHGQPVAGSHNRGTRNTIIHDSAEWWRRLLLSTPCRLDIGV
jgi:hypothetical protein